MANLFSPQNFGKLIKFLRNPRLNNFFSFDRDTLELDDRSRLFRRADKLSIKYDSLVLFDDPILYWRLDEGGGTEANDITGNNNHGTIIKDIPAASPWGDGFNEPQILTDGAGRSIEFNFVGNDALVQADFTAEGVCTVEMWIKLMNINLTQTVFMQSPSATKEFGIEVVHNTPTAEGTNDLTIFVNGVSETIPQTTVDLVDGFAHHLVVVLNKNLPEVKVYVDGNLVGTLTNASWNTALTAATQISLLNKRTPDGDDFGRGTISEFAMYAYNLSASQIKAHYGAGILEANTPINTYADQVIADAPKMYFRLQEKEGIPFDDNRQFPITDQTVIKDSSGNENNALLHNPGPTNQVEGNFPSILKQQDSTAMGWVGEQITNYITLSCSPDLPPININGFPFVPPAQISPTFPEDSVSVEMWFKTIGQLEPTGTGTVLMSYFSPGPVILSGGTYGPGSGSPATDTFTLEVGSFGPTVIDIGAISGSFSNVDQWALGLDILINSLVHPRKVFVQVKGSDIYLTGVGPELITISSITGNLGTTLGMVPVAQTGADEFLIYLRNIALNPGKIAFDIKNTVEELDISATPLNDNQVHHLVVTYQAQATNQVQVFIDSVNVGTLDNPGWTQPINPGGILILGQEQDSLGGGFDADQSFVGRMQDFAIYPYILSETQIKKHYVLGNLGSPVPLDSTVEIVSSLGVGGGGGGGGLDPTLIEDHVFIGDASGTAADKAMIGDVHIVADGTTTIQPDAVTYPKMQNIVTGNRVLGRASVGEIEEVQVTGDMIDPSADILLSQLEDLTSARIILGNALNRPTETVMSGDVRILNTGETIIQNNTITSDMIVNGTILDIDIAANARIAHTKLNRFGLGTNLIIAGPLGGAAIDATVSGDLTMDSAANFTIADGVIESANLSDQMREHLNVCTNADFALAAADGTYDPWSGSANIDVINDSMSNWDAVNNYWICDETGVYGIVAAVNWTLDTSSFTDARVYVYLRRQTSGGGTWNTLSIGDTEVGSFSASGSNGERQNVATFMGQIEAGWKVEPRFGKDNLAGTTTSNVTIIGGAGLNDRARTFFQVVRIS